MADTKPTDQTQAKPAEPARARRYKMRANAKAGKDYATGPGAFNGTCLVYEGDEFFLTIPVYEAKVRGPDGKVVFNPDGTPKTIARDGFIPKWCDPLAEYPLDSTPQPLRVMQPTA